MKVLLVQTAFLGDIILSTAVFERINQLHPNSKLFVLTTPAGAQILKGHPGLAGVVVYDKRGQYSGISGIWRMAKKLREYHFDLVYSLHKSYRTSLVLFLSKIPKRVGFKSARLAFLYTETKTKSQDNHDVLRSMSLFADANNQTSSKAKLSLSVPKKEEVSAELLTLAEQQLAIVVPGSAWATKRWSIDGFGAVAQWLKKQGFLVLALGSREEQALGQILEQNFGVKNLVGKTSIREMMYLIAQAKIVVCNDSSSLHFASAYKIPTVAIFCATSPEFGFGPWDNLAKVVEKKGLDCKPCSRHGAAVCPLATNACMSESLLPEVLQATQQLLIEAGQKTSGSICA